MNSICREIFRAIHEGKWLTIEYKNKQQSVTKYWIGILSLDVRRKSLRVDGLHLGNLGCTELNIYIDSILSAAVVEGSFQPRNETLIQDIRDYPEKYEALFHSTANLKILNWYNIRVEIQYEDIENLLLFYYNKDGKVRRNSDWINTSAR